MEYICQEIKNEKDIISFLSLPSKLYTKKYLTQDIKLEKQILHKIHPLSSTFEIKSYIVKNTSDDILARCILTFYRDDSSAYLGFFESVNDFAVTTCLLDTVVNVCKERKKEKIVGPYDCSFWIKYRFKTNYFENCYMSEPYNLDYYVKLWGDYGFKESQRYYSNQMRVPMLSDTSERAVKRLSRMKELGYTLRSFKYSSFEKDLSVLYNLIIKLYVDFPCYKYISETHFISMFKSLKYILKKELLFLAYKDDLLVGFFIGVPNYKNYVYNISVSHLLKILRVKSNPKEYVVLYMGIDPLHLGLGSAFAELGKQYFLEHNCTSIGALIREGNTSGNYYKNLKIKEYNYVLMEYLLD